LPLPAVTASGSSSKARSSSATRSTGGRKAAGEVRPDATTQDVGVVMLMVGEVMDAAEDVKPELWRRYLRIALQGPRPEGAPLEPLPVAAVKPKQMDDLLVGNWKRRRA